MENLEKEFLKAVAKHKIVIIRTALELRGEKLYNNYLLEDFKDKYNNMTSYEKSAKVESDLFMEYQEYKDNKYNQVYELCWETIKDKIPNGRTF